MQCVRCDHDYPEGDRFCGRCGLGRPVDGQAVDPLIGLTLNGRYRIERRIGVGGMGTVYLAGHVSLGQRVAVKVLHERYAREAQLAQRFENEARTYGRLSHPNLVTLHDFGQTPDGTLFMVELCVGSSLSALLLARGALPAALAIDIITQIAQGLLTAHDAGVIHRDLKPDNVMLLEARPGRYHVKLLDFGIAKSLHDDAPELTQAGMVFGTPEYMAPEQARGEPVDERTDVYALGAILYELLVGRPPFSGTNKMNLMHRQANEMPLPPSEIVGEAAVPPMVEAVVLRCLEKRPADRYPSAAALIEALEDSLGIARPGAPTLPRLGSLPTPTVHAGEKVRRPSTRWTPPPARERRAPGSLTLTLAIAGFCAAVGVSAWLWSAHSGTPAPAETVATGVAQPESRATPEPASAAPAPASAAVHVGAPPVVASRSAAPPPAPKVAEVHSAAPPKVAEPRSTAAADDEDAPHPADPELQHALRAGDLDEAARRASQLLRLHPHDPAAQAALTSLQSVRAAITRGRAAFEKDDCVEALNVLLPVIELVPGVRGVSHIISSCRAALPPKNL